MSPRIAILLVLFGLFCSASCAHWDKQTSISGFSLTPSFLPTGPQLTFDPSFQLKSLKSDGSLATASAQLITSPVSSNTINQSTSSSLSCTYSASGSSLDCSVNRTVASSFINSISVVNVTLGSGGPSLCQFSIRYYPIPTNLQIATWLGSTNETVSVRGWTRFEITGTQLDVTGAWSVRFCSIGVPPSVCRSVDSDSTFALWTKAGSLAAFSPALPVPSGTRVSAELTVDGRNFVLITANLRTSDPGPLRVCFIYPYFIKDSAWVRVNNDARISVENTVKDAIQTFIYENAYQSDAGIVIDDVAYRHALDTSKCRLIIATGVQHRNASLTYAALYPSVQFVVLSGIYSPPVALNNVMFGSIRLDDPAYLAGMAAASASKGGAVCFAMTLFHPMIIAAANAFTLGAKHIDSRVQVMVYLMNTFQDAWLEKNIALEFRSRGCDVVFSTSNTAITQSTFVEAGGMAIGFNEDLRVQLGDLAISSVFYKFSPMYMSFITSILSNSTVKKAVIPRGLGSGATTILPFSASVSGAAKLTIEEYTQKFLSMPEQEVVFCNFSILDSTGTGVVNHPNCFNFTNLGSMTTFVPGLRYFGQYIPPVKTNPSFHPNWALRLTLAFVGCVCSALVLLLLVWVLLYRRHPAMLAASPPLLVVLLLGAAAAFLYPVTSMSYPPTQTTCHARFWLGHMAFFFVFCSLFTKTWRIQMIFRVRMLKVKAVTNRQLLGWVTLQIVALSLMLLLWNIIDPPLPRVIFKTEEVVWCQSNRMEWHYAPLVVEGFFVLVGGVVAFLARDVPDDYNESRQIAMTIYNIVLAGCVVVPMVYSIGDNPDSSFALTAGGIILCTLTICLLLFYPKIIVVHSKTSSKVSAQVTPQNRLNSSGLGAGTRNLLRTVVGGGRSRVSGFGSGDVHDGARSSPAATGAAAAKSPVRVQQQQQAMSSSAALKPVTKRRGPAPTMAAGVLSMEKALQADVALKQQQQPLAPIVPAQQVAAAAASDTAQVPEATPSSPGQA